MRVDYLSNADGEEDIHYFLNWPWSFESEYVHYDYERALYIYLIVPGDGEYKFSMDVQILSTGEVYHSQEFIIRARHYTETEYPYYASGWMTVDLVDVK